MIFLLDFNMHAFYILFKLFYNQFKIYPYMPFNYFNIANLNISCRRLEVFLLACVLIATLPHINIFYFYYKLACLLLIFICYPDLSSYITETSEALIIFHHRYEIYSFYTYIYIKMFMGYHRKLD